MALRLSKNSTASWHMFISFVMLSLVVGAAFFIISANSASHANQVSWMVGEPSLENDQRFDEKVDADERVLNQCEMKDVYTIRHGYVSGNRLVTRRLCVSKGSGFLLGQTAHDTFVSFDTTGEGFFYKVRNIDNVWHLPGTDTVVTQNNQWVFGRGVAHHLKKFTNFSKRLSMDEAQQAYELDMTNPSYELMNSEGNQLFALGWGISNNGRYLVYGSRQGTTYAGAYDMLFWVDMQTGEQKFFGRGHYDYEHSYEPVPSYVVSNSGDMVISGGNGAMKTWKVTDQCLISLADYTKTTRYDDPCESRRFVPQSQELLAKVTRQSVGRMTVNDDFTKLTYYYDAAGLGGRRILTLLAPNYYPSGRLEYLAMGDSYSSGEGDVEDDGKYYMKGTGAKGDCHLSSRSYPYVLSGSWGIEKTGFQSIACSGARIVYDYISRPEYYLGQSNLIKERIYPLGKQAAYDKAIKEFLPGYIPQLEFVKKYKPRVLTVTGGGNDVGFADILHYCASLDICRYAISNSAKEELINSIRSQYGAVSLLIRKIKMTSPETKLYLIGYPQFIDQPVRTCALNGAALAGVERAMIREMVTEMNNVLWRAATDNGIPFIDIEDSLEGGQLCAGSKYMTGIHQLFPFKVFGDYFQESFHPNSVGHTQMAKTIQQKVNNPFAESAGDHRNALSAAEYEKSPIVKMVTMIEKSISKVRSEIKLTVESAQFKPGSEVEAVVYSEEVKLGKFLVNDQGGLETTVMLPENLRPGQHVLVVRGVDSNNNPVTFYQFITILGSNDNDVDDDGVDDPKDKCLFVEHWYDEQSGADICTAPDSGVDGGQQGENNEESTNTQPDTPPKKKHNFLASFRKAAIAGLAMIVIILLVGMIIL